MAKRFLTIKEAAGMLECTERHVQRMCRTCGLTGAIRQGKSWRIPVTADERFGGLPLFNAPAAATKIELAGIAPRKRDIAVKRAGLIKQFEIYCAQAMRDGAGRTVAISAFSAKEKIARRTFERWLAKYRGQGLAGLVDDRGNRSEADAISDDAFELFKSYYLDQRQPTVAACWRNICYINKSESRGWQIPPLSSMYRIVDQRVPTPVAVLHREGQAAYEAKCAPYIQTDPDSIEPGSVWVGDHSQFNCWIRHKGQWVRPWITVWQDMRSRKIVGRHICESPNSTTILLAFRQGAMEHGIPDSVKIDNGKDYDSQMFTGVTKSKRKAGWFDDDEQKTIAGLYGLMDITVSFAIPYHPQSKPIERWFDTMDKQFVKFVPTYCGKDTDRRPDDLAEQLKRQDVIEEAYDIDSFTKLVDSYIETFNSNAHSGRGMEGSSPDAVFNSRSSRRVMTDGVLDLLCRVWTGELKVGKNGVNIKGLWYGQYDLDLHMQFGKKVRAAYDPDDIRQVWVYDANTYKLICCAEQAQLIAYGNKVDDEQLREATRQKTRAVKMVRDAKNKELVAQSDLATLAIRALAEGKKETPSEKLTLRPVNTPLNNQVREHDRLEVLKHVRKAAGMEGTDKVLDLDFSLLTPKKETGKIKLFNK